MTSVDFLSLPDEDPSPDRAEWNDSDLPYMSSEDIENCFLNGGTLVCSKCDIYKICMDGQPV